MSHIPNGFHPSVETQPSNSVSISDRDRMFLPITEQILLALFEEDEREERERNLSALRHEVPSGPSQNQGQEALGRDPVIPEDEPMLNGEGLTNEEATPGEPHEEESANIRFETPERNDIEFIETIRIHPEHEIEDPLEEPSALNDNIDGSTAAL